MAQIVIVDGAVADGLRIAGLDLAQREADLLLGHAGDGGVGVNGLPLFPAPAVEAVRVVVKESAVGDEGPRAGLLIADGYGIDFSVTGMVGIGDEFKSQQDLLVAIRNVSGEGVRRGLLEHRADAEGRGPAEDADLMRVIDMTTDDGEVRQLVGDVHPHGFAEQDVEIFGDFGVKLAEVGKVVDGGGPVVFRSAVNGDGGVAFAIDEIRAQADGEDSEQEENLDDFFVFAHTVF